MYRLFYRQQTCAERGQVNTGRSSSCRFRREACLTVRSTSVTRSLLTVLRNITLSTTMLAMLLQFRAAGAEPPGPPRPQQPGVRHGSGGGRAHGGWSSGGPMGRCGVRHGPWRGGGRAGFLICTAQPWRRAYPWWVTAKPQRGIGNSRPAKSEVSGCNRKPKTTEYLVGGRVRVGGWVGGICVTAAK